jgi:hypothetical protein
MTIDKALAHLLFWTSTAPLVMDCFFSGDATIIPILASPYGTLRSQINAIAMKVFAKPLVNNYGQLYVEVDPQILPSAVRNTLPVIMEITNEDWIGALDIERIPRSRVSMIELSAQPDGVISPLVYSRAPGNIGKSHGEPLPYENYVVADQDECNRIAGCLLAAENNIYEPLEIKLAANNGLIDIAPRMYATISVAVGDTPRGITLSSARLIPRKVELDYDVRGFLLTNVTFEFEAVGVDGVTYYPPTPVEENYGDFKIPNLGAVDFPSTDLGTWFPPTVPPEVDTPCASGESNSFTLTWSPTELFGHLPDKLISRAYFPCKLRSTPGMSSYIDLKGFWLSGAREHYTVYAVKGGERVLTASLVDFTAFFTPVSDLEVDGFELELAEGLGSPVEYLVGDIISSGTVNATDDVGVTIPLVADEYYAIENTGSYYKGHAIGDTPNYPYLDYYNFCIKDSGRSNEPAIGVGGVGWWENRKTIPTTYVFESQLGTIGIQAYDLGFPKGRLIFKALEDVQFLVADAFRSDNSLTLSYLLRSVIVYGRRIKLLPSRLHNVCAV